MKRILTLLLCILLLFTLCGCEDDFFVIKSDVTMETVDEFLQKELERIRVSYKADHPVGEVNLSTSDNLFEYELPTIDKYPLNVRGAGEIDAEIFVPSLSSSSGIVNFMTEAAESFNGKKFTVDGKTISVSIRHLEPALADEYIYYQTYIPDAYVAENNLWSKLMQADGAAVNEVANRLAGNVDGFVLSREKYQELAEKYGSVALQVKVDTNDSNSDGSNLELEVNSSINIEIIARANNAGDIKLGYNDPYQNPASMNFVISMLSSFDEYNPVSIEATEEFVEFQNAIASVPYTTTQMKQAISTGALDALVLDYQSYQASEELEDYVFVPFGTRHDSPIYTIGDISKEKQEIIRLFVEHCQTAEMQSVATKYGLNQMEEYESDLPDYSGDVLYSALNLWKQEKDATKSVAAVFVADRSGSMNGNRIEKLRESLKNASQFINQENSIGLISYASDVCLNLPINEFNLEQMSYFIGEVDYLNASGGTDAYAGIMVGIGELLKAKETNPDCKLIMFMLSDGEWYSFDFTPIALLCEKYGIQIHVIGYEVNHEYMKQLANAGNGANIDADTDDISYLLKTFFNSQM